VKKPNTFKTSIPEADALAAATARLLNAHSSSHAELHAAAAQAPQSMDNTHAKRGAAKLKGKDGEGPSIEV
jgi:hypothetical protein